MNYEAAKEDRNVPRKTILMKEFLSKIIAGEISSFDEFYDLHGDNIDNIMMIIRMKHEMNEHLQVMTRNKMRKLS